MGEGYFYINTYGREIKVIGSNVTMPILGESDFFLILKKMAKLS